MTTEKTLTRTSPAKINWFLDVSPRREDGYHPVNTVLQRISLSDTLTFTPRTDEQVMLTMRSGSCQCSPQDNTILKAVHAFRTATGITRGVSISLEKHIPVGAGLGGGSSNAATTLVALSELWESPLTGAFLHTCATHIGADVPFFLSSACAVCSGIGDVCEPLAPGTFALVLWKPACALSTRQIYARFDTTGRPRSPIQPFITAYTRGNVSDVGEEVWNNLALASAEELPRLTTMCAQAEKAGAVRAWVSGSGPTVIALCTSDTHAQTVAAQLRNTYAADDDFILTATTRT